MESISYSPFTVNDNVVNSQSDPDIIFYDDNSPLDKKNLNPNEIREGFECLCKNGFSVLHHSHKKRKDSLETHAVLFIWTGKNKSKNQNNKKWWLLGGIA